VVDRRLSVRHFILSRPTTREYDERGPRHRGQERPNGHHRPRRSQVASQRERRGEGDYVADWNELQVVARGTPPHSQDQRPSHRRRDRPPGGVSASWRACWNIQILKAPREGKIKDIVLKSVPTAGVLTPSKPTSPPTRRNRGPAAGAKRKKPDADKNSSPTMTTDNGTSTSNP